MAESTGQITSNAASVYEEFFVPALFGEWAPRIATLAAALPGQTALDVACGTGVLARALARHVGPERVVGVDCNDEMLAVARRIAPEVGWQRATAESLPFDDDRFDVVGCQFGLMFFTNRVQALREMWRVLRPGGALVVAVWGALDRTPGYAAMSELLRRMFGAGIASELHAPFVLGDPEAFSSLISSAGIGNARIETLVGCARFPSIAAWVHTDIRGWTLADRLTDEQVEALQQAAGRELGRFRTSDGVAFESPAHVAVARK